MTSEKQQSRIDFSDAKEPPRSLNLEHEAAPIEPEEVSKDIQLNPNPDDLSRQDESTESLEKSQILKANISAG
ncbi:MAG: hypothetical protein ACHBN1_16840 [Heteroscytonema crispum UTEX LB 1556]